MANKVPMVVEAAPSVVANRRQAMALVAGHLGQIRLVVKPQPGPAAGFGAYKGDTYWPLAPGYGVVSSKSFGPADFVESINPFGPQGSTVVVLEEWRALRRYDSDPSASVPESMVSHVAGEEAYIGDLRPSPVGRMGKVRPASEMPRWASRMSMELRRTWVRRLQDMDHDDACLSGIENTRGGRMACIERFAAQWDAELGELNPGASHGELAAWTWEANPWVFVAEFGNRTLRVT